MVTKASTMPRRSFDWESLERDYRAGVLSVREIGVAYGVSHPAILKRAKASGWERDLAAKIKAKADEKVTKAAVTALVTAGIRANELQIVEANAEVISRVRLKHRTDIGRAQALLMRLMEELEHQTAQIPELAELGKAMRLPDATGTDRLNEVYQKIISLPARTKVMKDIGDTLKSMIGLERQAFGLDDEGADKPVREVSNEELVGKLRQLVDRVTPGAVPGGWAR